MRLVQWAESALTELEVQVVHIAKDDPDAAYRVSRRIRETGNALAEFATGHSGRVADTYEKSVVRLPYIIAYKLSEDGGTLTILHVIHTSRNWQPDSWPEG